MTEPYAVLITALVGASAVAVVLAVLLAAAITALWRTRRQRDAARRRAARQQTRIRHQRRRIAGYLAELDDITERTRPTAAALLGQDEPLTGWAARAAEQIAALPETPATWPVIPGPDGPEVDR